MAPCITGCDITDLRAYYCAHAQPQGLTGRHDKCSVIPQNKNNVGLGKLAQNAARGKCGGGEAGERNGIAYEVDMHCWFDHLAAMPLIKLGLLFRLPFLFIQCHQNLRAYTNQGLCEIARHCKFCEDMPSAGWVAVCIGD